jgi:hypothetical protein
MLLLPTPKVGINTLLFVKKEKLEICTSGAMKSGVPTMERAMSD